MGKVCGCFVLVNVAGKVCGCFVLVNVVNMGLQCSYHGEGVWLFCVSERSQHRSSA